MTIHAAICNVFKEPRGPLGSLAGWVMANRPSNRERNLWTVELLDLQPEHRVLELGCGPGIALEACAARLPQGHVVGIDHSQTMIRQARSRLSKAIEDGRVELMLGDLDVLTTIQPKSFDRIYSANVVQFLPDKVEAYRRIFATLAPNGVAATTYQPRNSNPTREDALRMAEEVSRAMGEVGFADIHTKELAIKPVPAVCVLGRRPPGTE